MTSGRLFAIDPGPEFSAWVLYDLETGMPTEWAKEPNLDVLHGIAMEMGDHMAIEKVESFGMAVGAQVFETVFWSGRFAQKWASSIFREPPFRVGRREVKLHLCGSVRAKDSNIRQALIDRYGPDKERAVGVKASPGPLYGMKADCWAALAVAVTTAETHINVDKVVA